MIGHDGRIEEIGSQAEIAVQADAVHRSYAGKTILPGLIDMHAHLVVSTNDEAKSPSDGATANQTIRGLENARRCVSRGITTIRDAGARSHIIFTIRDAIDDGRIPGPRVYAAGRALTATGGHSWNAVGTEVDGADQFRRLAREQLKAGADCIKLMMTAGVGSPGQRTEDTHMTPDEARAAVEEAHNRGKHVLAHVSNAQTALDAVRVGVDCIEHGLLLDEEAISAMAAAGTYFCPTMACYERIVQLGTNAGYYAYMVERSLKVLEPHNRALHLAIRSGVKIVAGTDAGGHYWKLGDLADELECLSRAGMSNAQCIDAATKTAAECLRSDDVGILEPGRYGDVIVVDGDPLTDLGFLQRPSAVYVGGRLMAEEGTISDAAV